VAVLFIDLDWFKVVNDTLGHRAGDVVLVELAARMRSVLRDTDTVARLSGDEFVVCEDLDTSPDGDPGWLGELTDRLDAVIARDIPVDDVAVSPSASIGVAVTTGRRDPMDLVAEADMAMYVVKDAGRGVLRMTGADAALPDGG